MEEQLVRLWENLTGRVSGPLHFRLFIQPSVALFFGIWDGLNDARQGKPAYFWSIFTDKTQRRTLLREGWTAVSKVFLVALLLDAVYQLLVLRFVYPGEAIIVAFLLAMLPYLLIRGPTNRIARIIFRERYR